MSFKFVCLMASSAMGIFGAAALAADVTGTTGGGQPHINEQPSLGITYLVALQGSFPTQTSTSNMPVYLGDIVMFAGNFSPGGFATAGGQLLPISQDQALFQLYGTAYGGNGVTTFALPNLQNRVPIGAGQGNGLTNRPLGSVVGSDAETLTIDQMPAHDHSTPDGPTGDTGGGQPIPIMEPSLAVNYYINAAGNSDGTRPVLGAVRMTGSSLVPPTGGLLANGQNLTAAQNAALVNLLSGKFGGNFPTDANVPDLRGRAAIGSGSSNRLTPQTLGEVEGQESVTLTDAQLPPHTHTLPGGGTTGVEGGGQSFSKMQPSLGLNYIIATQGIFPTDSGGSSIDSSAPFIGEMSLYAGNTAPAGWMFCDGQALSLSDPDDALLFQIIGTTYGGDGVTTFDLPDLQGRLAVGAGAGTDGQTEVLAETIGVENVTLVVNQIPAHDHTVPEPASLSLLASIGSLMLRRQR